MYDLVIKNGNIIDGTGSPGFHADIAIKEGKIAKIARNINDAKKIIDAKGLTVTPGFIDSHSHSDSTLLSHPDQTEKVEQGITTAIGGNCGLSPAPLPIDFPEDSQDEVGDFGKKTEVYKILLPKWLPRKIMKFFFAQMALYYLDKFLEDENA